MLCSGRWAGDPPISGLPLGPNRLRPVSFGVTLAFWGGRVLGMLSASNFSPARTRIRCTGTAQPLRAVPGGSPRGASRAKEMKTFPLSGSFGVPRGRLGVPWGHLRGEKWKSRSRLAWEAGSQGGPSQTPSESGLAKAARKLLLSESVAFSWNTTTATTAKREFCFFAAHRHRHHR